MPLTLPRRNMARMFYFALPRKRYHLDAVDAWMDNCRAMDRDMEARLRG